MLTPYDELPVHQLPHPLSVVSNTDPGFDDGFYFGVFSSAARTFWFMGMRINPNTDLVGGFVGGIRDGVQRTVRFSRTWHEASETAIGPYRIEIIEAFREMHLTLGDNPSGLRMDLTWLAAAGPFEEEHHFATNRGRPTTDQTRYSQAGTARGWIKIDGERVTVDPDGWNGARDHSWGLYHQRAPLAPDPRWLPPPDPGGVPRSFRLWTVFRAAPLSGFFHLHETADGRQVKMNDVFGTPFEARFDFGWGESVQFQAGRHELTFVPGTKVMISGTVTLTDDAGGIWRQHFAPVNAHWVTVTAGYEKGSWRDGGSFRTYHGPGVSVEWDEFDFTQQPVDHVMYDGAIREQHVGRVYLCRITTVAPDGREFVGDGHVELSIDGPYPRYGF